LGALEARVRQWLVCGSALRHENIYKIHAESFEGPTHLHALVNEAQEMVNNALRPEYGNEQAWRD